MKLKEVFCLMLLFGVGESFDDCTNFWKKWKNVSCDADWCFTSMDQSVKIYNSSRKFTIKCYYNTPDPDIVKCSNIKQIKVLNIMNCIYGKTTKPFLMTTLLGSTKARHINVTYKGDASRYLYITFSNLQTTQSISVNHFRVVSGWMPVRFRHGMDSLKTVEINDHNFKFIAGHQFHNVSNLEKLIVRNGTLSNVPETAFQKLSQLLHLNLSWNNIHNLQPIHFQKLRNLRELDLTGNRIKYIRGLFSTTKHLKKLRLGSNGFSRLWQIPSNVTEFEIHDNNLQQLPSPLMNMIDRKPQFKISLAKNDWRCDDVILEWYCRNAKKIIDFNDVFCVILKNKSTKEMTKHRLKEFCFVPKQHNMFIYFSTVLILVLILMVYVCYYRYTIMAILYDNKLLPFSHAKPKDNKEYDLFFCSDESDTSIAEAFIKKLEPVYRLCIPERDWAKDGRVSANVAHSIHNSRATLLFITKKALEHIWFQVQFRGAYNQRIQDDVHKLILVIGGDIKGAMTKDDILYVIENESKLVWGERWFWEKLRYKLRSPLRRNR